MNNFFLNCEQVDVIFGCNGNIWITRSIPISWWQEMEAIANGSDQSMSAMNIDCGDGGGGLLRGGGSAEKNNSFQIKESYIRRKHATTPLSTEDRERISRIRNSIYILAQLQCIISKFSVDAVYRKSASLNVAVADMLSSDKIILIGNSLTLTSLGEER